MNSKIVDLGKRFKAVRNAHDELSKQLKECNALWADIEQQLLDAMVDEGANSVDLIGIGKFTMSTKNYLSVKIENKPKFYEYLKSSGNGGLLKEDVNPRTLTAFLKTHLEELIKQYQDHAGEDAIDARERALKELNEHGASYFSDKTIKFTEE